jgi:hypothetical protein
MSIRKRIALLTAFSASALGSFVVAAPSDARSTVHAMASYACYNWQSTVGSTMWEDYYCAVPVGSDFTTGNLNGLYVDTQTYSTTMWNYVEADKYSYTGVAYADYMYLPSTQTSMSDYYLPANNIKKNPSVFDYLILQVKLSGATGTLTPYSGPYFLGFAAWGQ